MASQRFEILDVLGSGGMGCVYRAWDSAMEQHVALKSIRPELVNDLQLERLRREVKLARRIKHVNVAQVHDLVEQDGVRYLAMECVEGRSLSELVGRRGRLPLKVVMGLFIQACRGVEAAHELGIVHRDLKPHNIMVSRKGRALVLDFGIAALDGESSVRDGRILGSPQYLSPEQLHGEPVTPASDVHALGTVLFELCTGVSPFRMPGASASALRALREVPPDPLHVEPRLPPFLAWIIARCLARKPEHRYESAGALADDIEYHRGPIEIPDPEVPGPPEVLLAVPACAERELLADRLKRLGCDAVVTGDGEEALQSCLGGRFSLAVLSASLPGVDGLTACQLLRRAPQCEDTERIVLLDEGSDAGREAFARQVGAHDVVHRPVNVHAFARIVRQALVA
ncbi:MAG: serine/threonine-protein kinase [Acidobacteriota bacterium]